MKLRACTSCKETFELTKANFYSNGYDKNGKQVLKSKCKKCLDDHHKNRMKDIILNHFGKYECTSCGYNKCIRAIEFHHMDTTEKEVEVSQMNSYSKERIVSELEKCLMLCANCHREIHEGLIDKDEIIKKQACIKISVDDPLDEASTPPPPLFKRMIGWFI